MRTCRRNHAGGCVRPETHEGDCRNYEEENTHNSTLLQNAWITETEFDGECLTLKTLDGFTFHVKAAGTWAYAGCLDIEVETT